MIALSECELLPFSEFIKKLHCSPRKGRRIIASGKVGVVRVGKAVLIPAAELVRFLSDNYTPARDETKPIPQDIGTMLDNVLPRKRGQRK